MRSAVLCPSCNKAHTSGWPRGLHGTRCPYYLCYQKGCERYSKSIKRDQMEGDFARCCCDDSRSLRYEGCEQDAPVAEDDRAQYTAQLKAQFERQLAEIDGNVTKLNRTASLKWTLPESSRP